jgi:hypothetical protein
MFKYDPDIMLAITDTDVLTQTREYGYTLFYYTKRTNYLYMNLYPSMIPFRTAPLAVVWYVRYRPVDFIHELWA